VGRGIPGVRESVCITCGCGVVFEGSNDKHTYKGALTDKY
jgi:hypothetical protein